MVATPDFLVLSASSPDERAGRVRLGAAVCAVGQQARVALRTLRADLERAARLRLLPPPAVRLLALHRALVPPQLADLPDRIEALLELVDDVPAAAASVGLDARRTRRMAGRAAALRGALELRKAWAA